MINPIPVFLAFAAVLGAAPFDIAPFARPCCSRDVHNLPTTFDYSHPAGVVQRGDGSWVYGLQWAEERDIREIAVRLAEPRDAADARVEYWFSNWPYPGPGGQHTIEDPVDDPWQGRWIAAAATSRCDGETCRFLFSALETGENPRAANLAGVDYRRTLKVRLLFARRPAIGSVRVYSASEVRRYSVRLAYQGAEQCRGEAGFQAYNGVVVRQRSSGCEAAAEIDGTDPKPAGSNDVTVVKVTRNGAAFSFAPADLDGGPMPIPQQRVTVTKADRGAAPVQSGRRIRERIPGEPEQSFERASREIPPLDPVVRSAGRLELPLSLDSGWQKFGFQWGGHVRISKRATKAFGQELARLAWPGDEIAWRIGTGETPSFRDEAAESSLSQLEDYLPIGTARWSSGGLEYEEEALATSLSGPLSPLDPARDERTPAVLCLRLKIRNAGAAARTAHVWVVMKPAEALAFDGRFLTAAGGRFTRAVFHLPAGATAVAGEVAEREGGAPALHVTQSVPAGGESSVAFAIPFVPELAGGEKARLLALSHEGERARVLGYWREATRNAVPFEVPEERFNRFARGLAARIRMAVTKDPRSGLYMVPAANMGYRVYANEAAFQCQLLDLLGQHDLAARYLRTHVALQGSKPLAGTFNGDQRDVYYGARVDEDYDYTAVPYNLAHGTVLWSLAEHFMITRDRAWLREVGPSMKRAARWIVAQRALTRAAPGSPEFGLLPAGRLEDNHDWGHWFSVNATASQGMTVLASALTDAGDPEARWFGEQARLYREDVRAAVLRAVEDAPVVRLRDGSYSPYVPAMGHQRLRFFGPLRTGYYSRYGAREMPTFRLSATRELLYGPLALVQTGVFTADEPIADWLLDDWEDNLTTSAPLGLSVHGWVDEELWFSRGGMVFQANLQNPIPTYLRRGEIPAAIRSLYNNFVSCYYPSVNVLTEEYRRWRYPSGPFFKIPDEARFVHRLRDLLLVEQGGELELAKGTPRRWLAEGSRISVRQAPSRFGPVSYTLTASAGEVRGSIELPVRNRLEGAWISVRLPEELRIRTVSVDGRSVTDFDGGTGRIRLRPGGRRMELLVTTERRR